MRFARKVATEPMKDTWSPITILTTKTPPLQPQIKKTNHLPSTGIPLVRHHPNPPLPPPHPPTPRRPGPNLEHRILQLARILQTTDDLGKDPPNPHPRLRRLAAALPQRKVAGRLPEPSLPLAAETADSGRWAAFQYAVGGGEGGVDGLGDEGGALGEVSDAGAGCCVGGGGVGG